MTCTIGNHPPVSVCVTCDKPCPLDAEENLDDWIIQTCMECKGRLEPKCEDCDYANV